MTRTSSRFRLLVFVLTLHLAHVPIPVCDGGDGIALGPVYEHGPEWASPPEQRWDIDLLLLGVDPPEDSDEGPIDSRPENPDAELFESNCLTRPAMIAGARIRLAGGGGPLAMPWRVALRVLQSPQGIQRFPGSFGASYPCGRAWRQLLSVLTL